jgi:asparagine synthase (glutamine-hydrolysing)
MQAAVGETLRKAALLKNPFSQSLIQSLTLGKPASRSINAVTNWLKNFGGMRSSWQNVRKNLKNPDQFVFYEKLSDFVLASEQLPKLYSQNFAEQIAENDASSIFDFSDKWNDVEITLTALACATYLRENGITQGDRLGMASSVEMRLPLVDHKFVETVVGLRKTQTDAHLPPKYWLKEAVKDVLPEWVLNRPKRGFAPPTRKWHEAIFAKYGESLNEGFLVQADILSRESSLHLAQGEFPGEAITPISFKALVLEHWCRQMQNISTV